MALEAGSVATARVWSDGTVVADMRDGSTLRVDAPAHALELRPSPAATPIRTLLCYATARYRPLLHWSVPPTIHFYYLSDQSLLVAVINVCFTRPSQSTCCATARTALRTPATSLTVPNRALCLRNTYVEDTRHPAACFRSDCFTVCWSGRSSHGARRDAIIEILKAPCALTERQDRGSRSAQWCDIQDDAAVLASATLNPDGSASRFARKHVTGCSSVTVASLGSAGQPSMTLASHGQSASYRSLAHSPPASPRLPGASQRH